MNGPALGQGGGDGGYDVGDVVELQVADGPLVVCVEAEKRDGGSDTGGRPGGYQGRVGGLGVGFLLDESGEHTVHPVQDRSRGAEVLLQEGLEIVLK